MNDKKPTCDIVFFGVNKRCETHNRVFAVNHPCPGPVIATEPETPASDPTAELRERLETIAGYHDPHDSEGVQWCRACGTCFPCVTRVELDAVLDALKGERK